MTRQPNRGSANRAEAVPVAVRDQSLLEEFAPGGEREVPWWTAKVSVATEASGLEEAERATTRTLLALVLAAVVTAGGLVWSVRAARAAAALATAQSEFMSAMNHEMKAPLSLIALASNTLAHGRYTSPATVPEYRPSPQPGGPPPGPAHRQRALLRATPHRRGGPCRSTGRGGADPGVRGALPPAVGGSRHRRAGAAADRRGLDSRRSQLILHAIDNLVDNAAKHGGAGRRLVVRAALENSQVAMNVADAGQGIPAEELPRVFDTFSRGPGTRAPAAAGSASPSSGASSAITAGPCRWRAMSGRAPRSQSCCQPAPRRPRRPRRHPPRRVGQLFRAAHGPADAAPTRAIARKHMSAAPRGSRRRRSAATHAQQHRAGSNQQRQWSDRPDRCRRRRGRAVHQALVADLTLRRRAPSTPVVGGSTPPA